MNYEKQLAACLKSTPRLVIHGGAGNIVRQNFPSDKYEQYRTSLLEIVGLTVLFQYRFQD